VRRRGKAKRRQSETGFFVVFATIEIFFMFYNRLDETMTLLKTLSQDTVYLNNLIITQTIFFIPQFRLWLHARRTPSAYVYLFLHITSRHRFHAPGCATVVQRQRVIVERNGLAEKRSIIITIATPATAAVAAAAGDPRLL